ncbi:hypothetical protein TNCV_2867971 [Trichonephila clavipes]|nr:hypothetical protein TNCV_2867971 [Trichonephila clavipes]
MDAGRDNFRSCRLNPPCHTSRSDDRYIMCMTVIDRSTTSRIVISKYDLLYRVGPIQCYLEQSAISRKGHGSQIVMVVSSMSALLNSEFTEEPPCRGLVLVTSDMAPSPYMGVVCKLEEWNANSLSQVSSLLDDRDSKF